MLLVVGSEIYRAQVKIIIIFPNRTDEAAYHLPFFFIETNIKPFISQYGANSKFGTTK